METSASAYHCYVFGPFTLASFPIITLASFPIIAPPVPSGATRRVHDVSGLQAQPVEHVNEGRGDVGGAVMGPGGAGLGRRDGACIYTRVLHKYCA
jgi:hypothetical protein